MQVAYNYDRKLVVYRCGTGVSCFGLLPEKTKEIASELSEQCSRETNYPLGYVEVSIDKYNALYNAHIAEMFSTINGYQVPKSTPRRFVETILDAYEMNQPVLVEYKEGWGMLSDEGYSDDDGNVHVCWIGQTTGSTKSFIHLEKPASLGGPIFSFHGVKSIQVLAA